MSRFAIIMFAVLAANAVYAQDPMTLSAIASDEEKEGPWSGFISAGYTETSGNSESSAANAAVGLRHDKDRWHHIFGATAVASKAAADRDSEVEVSAESYWAGIKSQYDLTARYYAFGSVDWYKDRFSAYDRQVYEAVGLGWRVLLGPTHLLDVEAGVGLRQSKLQSSGESQRDVIGLLRGVYTWNISENAAFGQKLGILAGSDNTYVESTTELKANIVGNLALALAYTIKHNTDVEIDTSVTPERPYEKTDRYTTLSLEYSF